MSNIDEHKGSLERDGYTLHYLVKGKGKDILVIGSSIFYPRIFSEPFFEQFRMTFIDHRGFSLPTRSKATYTLDDVVEDLEACRKMLALNRFSLLGHSGHGFMALAYANKYPDQVERIILSNLAPTNSSERQKASIEYFESNAEAERKVYFYQQLAKAQHKLKTEPTKRFTHLNIGMQAHSFYDYKYDGAWLWEGVENHLPALDYLWGEAFATFPLDKVLKELKSPLTLFLGKYDYLVAPTSLWAAYLDKYPQINYYVFEESAHYPMLEEAPLYLKLAVLLPPRYQRGHHHLFSAEPLFPHFDRPEAVDLWLLLAE